MMETNFLQVDTNSSLVRDVQTGAILNRNTTELEEYRRKRSANLQIKKQIQEQAEDIKNLKDDISDIKNMLSQLLNRG